MNLPPSLIRDLAESMILIGTSNPSLPPSVLTSDTSSVFRYGMLQITRSNCWFMASAPLQQTLLAVKYPCFFKTLKSRSVPTTKENDFSKRAAK